MNRFLIKYVYDHKAYLIAITLLFSVFNGGGVAFAQSPDALISGSRNITTSIYFNTNDATLDIDDDIEEFISIVNSLYNNNRIQKIIIRGSSSPDGNANHNKNLTLRRAQAFVDVLTSHNPDIAGIIEVENLGENWELLLVLAQETLSGKEYADILRLSESKISLDSKEQSLRNINGGLTWSNLLKHVFPKLRFVSVELVLSDMPETPDLPGTDDTVVEITGPVDADWISLESDSMPLESAAAYGPRNWYLRTNLPAWLMLVANISAEFDIADHFSVMLPVYYSGWNYFTRTLKYRTFTVLPEIRWWQNADNRGLFLNVHGGFSYYNIALNGNSRYQDHDGKTPAWGGGVGIGYRLSPRGDSPWQFEFSVGAGVYHLNYDTFANEPDGLLTGNRRRTFIGIDNAAVSISYRFPLKKKGGAR